MAIDEEHEARIAALRGVLSGQPANPELAGLLVELGSLETNVDPPAAVEHLRAAVALLTEPRHKARAAGQLAIALGECDRYQDAVELLDWAATSVRSVDPQLRFDLEIDLLGLARHDPGTAVLIGPRLARMRDLFGATPESRRRIDAVLAERASTIDHPPPRETLRLALNAIGPGPMTQIRDVRAFSNAVAALVHIEEFDRATELCDLVLSSDTGNLPLAEGLAYTLRAEISYQRGELAAARHDIDAARHIVDARTPRRGLLPALVQYVHVKIAIEHGDPPESFVDVDNHRRAPLLFRSSFVLFTRGLVRVAHNELEPALADFLDCGKTLQKWGIFDHPHLPWRIHAAELYARLAQYPAALRLARAQLKSARNRGVPVALGIALRTVGMLCDDADLLSESVDVLRKTKATLEYAKSLLRLALNLNRSPYAITLLRQAREHASACAARPLVAYLDNLLDGNTPTAAETLTPNERKVAALAAMGKKNLEIADELGLAKRTVEFHLTNAYRKLGILNRKDLAHIQTSLIDPPR